MFLAITHQKVIDTPFAAAVPEVTAEMAEALGVPAGPAVPEVVEVSHLEVARAYVEPHEAQVARNIADGVAAGYYEIQFTGLVPNLSVVTETPLPRLAAPARERVNIENAQGDPVGFAFVDV